MPYIYSDWSLPQQERADQQIRLNNGTLLPPAVSAILSARLPDDSQSVDDFLFPGFQMLPDPFGLLGMDAATDLVLAALEQGRPIAVFGDYDVDGVTATTVLIRFFTTIGLQARYYHPDRGREGYGLHKNALDRIGLELGSPLLITVDCGVSDLEAIAYAKEKGMQVIVTDHHLPPQELPPADVILNPLQPGCQFSCKNMAGVGIAFYLTMALRARLRQKGFWRNTTEPNLKNLLDLVALGSVADMVPLHGVNRALVRAGLDVVRQTLGNPGLRELIRLCGVDHRSMSAEDIGFRLAPRVNAAGRLADAGQATALFTCDDPREAKSLCVTLNKLNEQRKDLVDLICAQAMNMAEEQVAQGVNGLVLHDPQWHPGVIGIVAARVTDRFHRPAVVFSGEPVAKGSARTIPAIDIYEGLSRCQELFEGFGGHRQAAGVSMAVTEMDRFADRFNQVLGEMISKEDLRHELVLDAIIDPKEIDEQFYGQYKLLEPFGNGNPEPVFVTSEPCRLRNVKVIGKRSDHLRFTLHGKNGWLNCIGFGFGHLAGRLTKEEVKLAFAIKPDNYNGRQGVQLHLVDVDLEKEKDN